MGLKMKIAGLISGIFAEVAVTWYNTYGDTEIWSTEHFLRISLVAAILSFFIKIIGSANNLMVATCFTSGVLLVIIAAVIYDLFLENTINYSNFPYGLFYALIVFAASYVGAFLGQLILKDRYK